MRTKCIGVVLVSLCSLSVYAQNPSDSVGKGVTMPTPPKKVKPAEASPANSPAQIKVEDYAPPSYPPVNLEGNKAVIKNKPDTAAATKSVQDMKNTDCTKSFTPFYCVDIEKMPKTAQEDSKSKPSNGAIARAAAIAAKVIMTIK